MSDGGNDESGGVPGGEHVGSGGDRDDRKDTCGGDRSDRGDPGRDASDLHDAASVGFEEGMEALEKLVARLESGDLPLEEALREFEHGVGLVRLLNDRLNAAERRIEILTRAGDGSLQIRLAEEDDP